jgi:aerobic carbon-monoxide dehydrogenase medium subunit
VYPSAFDYVAPRSLDEAIGLLQEHGDDAKVLAGGHSLIPLMKLQLAAPPILVDIGRIPELTGIETTNGSIELGALTTYTAVLDSPAVAQVSPLLAETATHVGDMQVRNRGTLGGSVAHADPAGDMPAAMLALEATFTARGTHGERKLAAGDFFQGPFTTDLQPDEVLTRIVVPGLPGRSGTAYEKMRNPASGYATVGVAVALTLGDGDTVSDVRVGITGAGSQPVRARAVEEQLRGQAPDEATIAAAAEHATDGLEVMGDIHASPEYRSHLASVYTRRALMRALERARG